MRLESGSAAAGVCFALVAYGIWGFAPIYWKALEIVPAGELLGQRIVWSAAVGALGLSVLGAWPEARRILRSPRRLAPILASALLIAVNWLTFIWAVNHDQIIATSLGYYVTPLVSVLLGTLLLGERLRPWQVAAVLLAAVGVLGFVIELGRLPWVAGILAFSFGLYGLVRKIVPVSPTVGFAVETLVLAPGALAYLAFLSVGNENVVPLTDATLDALIVGTGLLTATPLICFTNATRRLRLSSVGFFQYLAPSITLVLAVALFGEPFTRTHAVTFGCVWLALAVYAWDSTRALRGAASIGYGRPAGGPAEDS